MVIQIVASKDGNPLSLLIRLLCNSPYSHVGIKLSDNYMMDANWGGVKLRELPKKYDLYEVDVTPEGKKRANSWLKRQYNKKYDFIGSIGTAVYNALGKKREKNILDKDNYYTCSELVFRYCEAAGIKLLCNVDSANFHPGHLSTSKVRLIHKVV